MTVRSAPPPPAGATTSRTAPRSVSAWLTRIASATPSPFGENWVAEAATEPAGPRVGAVRSIVNDTVFVVSRWPVTSVERKATWWGPAADTTTGPPYGVSGAPSTAISLVATPLWASLAARLTLTSSR